MQSVLDLLRRPSSKDADDGGKALIYVWALEQKDSRRGWDEGHEQDVMVPWVLHGKKEKKEKGRRKRKDEASKDVETAKAEEASKGDDVEREKEQSGSKTFLRYYHLYREGELEHDVKQAGGRVVEKGYEKDNWWAIVTPNGNT